MVPHQRSTVMVHLLIAIYRLHSKYLPSGLFFSISLMRRALRDLVISVVLIFLTCIAMQLATGANVRWRVALTTTYRTGALACSVSVIRCFLSRPRAVDSSFGPSQAARQLPLGARLSAVANFALSALWLVWQEVHDNWNDSSSS